jgi:hypothetical protein
MVKVLEILSIPARKTRSSAVSRGAIAATNRRRRHAFGLGVHFGHYVENTGDTDLQFVTVFRAPRYEEVSLSNWLTHTPPGLVAQHLNVDASTIAKWPDNTPGTMPKA